MKTFKYRIYPTKSQISKLEEQLELCRFVYNQFLVSKKTAWENDKVNISHFDLIKTLPLKKQVRPELKKVHSTTLQNLGLRLKKSFDSFFRRVKSGEKPGYPRFKAKGRFRSLNFPQWGNGIRIVEQFLDISKIGKVKIILHRNIPGSAIIKSATISKQNDKWYVSIYVDKIHKTELPKTGKSVGIDVGITNFLTTNANDKVTNPRFFEKDQKDLARKQRKKDWIKYHKIHERIKNRRNNFAFQTANSLVKQYDIICIEDLDINNMLQKHWISKQISDVSWGDFFLKLVYKAENAGKKVVKVNPAYTSQICSQCDNVCRKELKCRVHSCDCGLNIGRDHNAAINILRLGLQSLGLDP